MPDRSIAITMLTAMWLAASAAPALSQSSLTYPVVDTGQTQRFDNRGAVSSSSPLAAFPGQDADYSGHQPDYTDNGDGTVTDNVTGLMWEKGYLKTAWTDAGKAAADDRTGGYADWRVPTIKELYSLMNFTGNQGSGDPSSSTAPKDARAFIDISAFDFDYPGSGRYIDVQFVTSTVYTARVMDGQECFFGVNVADGRIKCYPLQPRQSAGHYHARFVRGNPGYGSNEFTANADGTVSDAATGLVWTAVDSGDPALGGDRAGPLTWQQALELAETSTYAGHDDWRLPNAKELQSIVDYTRAPDTTGSAAIDPVFSATPVTNIAGDPDFPTYWTSTSFEPGRDAVTIFFGRAMGYFQTPGSAGKQFIDVHGAGAQRTNPKTGEDSYGKGPQGDVITVRNYVRLVRDSD